jgi:competence protein ComEC
VKVLQLFRLRRTTVIIAVCAAFLAGVALAYYWPEARPWWLLLVPFWVVALGRRPLLAAGLVLVISFGIGWSRGAAYAAQLAVYDDLNKRQVTLVGRAADDGVYGERYQLVFRLDQVTFAAPYRARPPGSMTIKGFGAPAITRGDIVQVSGKLYRARGNNAAGISFAKITVLRASDSGFEQFRRRFVAGMQTALPEPAASFGLGLLIGQRSTLPQEHADQLRMVGLTHIIAVSGYNLTIIIEICRRWFGKLSKFQNTLTCLGLIGLFLAVTGLSPPIVRAAVVSVIGLAAWYYGRQLKPMVLLLVGAAITVFAEPSYLWGNVSWYLSFLAFFGVLMLAPLLTRRLYGERQPKLMTQILLESFCASIMTVPYILYIFGQTSSVALLANLLVVPLIPITMVATLLAGLGGMLVPMLAGWLAWPATALLTFMLDVATLLSRVPHAFIEHIGFSFGSMLFVYAAVVFVTWILWLKCGRNSVTITDKPQINERGV